MCNVPLASCTDLLRCETANKGDVEDVETEVVMKQFKVSRRDFNRRALAGLGLGIWGVAQAQQQVITSTGQGMEGEITSTAPYRRRAAMPPQGSSPVATPPPGSAPAATVLILGDSLSAEYGIAQGKGWVALLADKLKAERPDVRVVNASISGETTAGGRSRLPALLDQIRPVQVVIELGANDALRGMDLDSTQNNLEAMIQACRAVNARVVLVGMQIPPNYGPDYSAKFAVMYASLSKKYHTGLVPFFLKGVADVPEAAKLFQPDHIHPKEEAHPRMLGNVWPEIKKQLSSQ
jgi:acyl-CoA thioesterase-1